MKPWVKLLIEMGPLLVFFAANAKLGVFWGTGLFMAATVAALIASWVLVRHIPVMPLASGVIVLIFGGLTLYLHDDFFIKIKPTLIYGLFAAAIGGSLLFGQNFLKTAMEAALPPLQDIAWRIMAIRWTVFFIVMAIANEIVWRNFSTDAWISFKLFGVTPVAFLFSFAQAPLMNRYAITDEET